MYENPKNETDISLAKRKFELLKNLHQSGNIAWTEQTGYKGSRYHSDTVDYSGVAVLEDHVIHVWIGKYADSPGRPLFYRLGLIKLDRNIHNVQARHSLSIPDHAVSGSKGLWEAAGVEKEVDSLFQSVKAIVESGLDSNKRLIQLQTEESSELSALEKLIRA